MATLDENLTLLRAQLERLSRLGRRRQEANAAVSQFQARVIRLDAEIQALNGDIDRLGQTLKSQLDDRRPEPGGPARA